MHIPRFEFPKIDDEILAKIKEFDEEEFKSSDAYKKHFVPMLERERRLKKQNRISWWKVNWINVITLIVTVLSLILSIVFGVLQLHH